jgi:hypothetical protein
MVCGSLNSRRVLFETLFLRGASEEFFDQTSVHEFLHSILPRSNQVLRLRSVILTMKIASLAIRNSSEDSP